MRNEKQFLLDEVKEKIESSESFFVTSYQNLDAGKVRKFRDLVAGANGEFEVVRKRVFLKAAEAAGLKLDLAELRGHVGVVFARDETNQVPKVTVNFGEENEQAVQVLCGHVNGEYCTAEDVIALAKLPSHDELKAQLLSVLEAPMSQTIATLQAVLTSIIYCLDEKANKEE